MSKPGLREAFYTDGKADDCPIVDVHAHMGAWKGIFFPSDTPEKIIHRMDRAGVSLAIFSHHAAISSPDVMNQPALTAARLFPKRLKAYCGIHPGYPKILTRELESFEQNRDSYVGFKLHGATHKTAYTGPGYRPLWEFAQVRRLPVLVHTWADSLLCGPEVLDTVAGDYPKIPIILGHSFHNDWQAAVDMAERHANLYFDLCAVLDERSGVLEKFVKEIGPRRILFGTDIPWFDFHYYIGAVLAAEIEDEDRRDIFYRNAVRLFQLKEVKADAS